MDVVTEICIIYPGVQLEPRGLMYSRREVVSSELVEVLVP
jgi:hypothetical protein